MAKGTKYSQQFKEDAVQYRLDHPELPLRKAAENLGVSESALKNWMKAAKEHKGEVPTRGSGNYAMILVKRALRLTTCADNSLKFFHRQFPPLDSDSRVVSILPLLGFD